MLTRPLPSVSTALLPEVGIFSSILLRFEPDHRDCRGAPAPGSGLSSAGAALTAQACGLRALPRGRTGEAPGAKARGDAGQPSVAGRTGLHEVGLCGQGQAAPPQAGLTRRRVRFTSRRTCLSHVLAPRASAGTVLGRRRDPALPEEPGGTQVPLAPRNVLPLLFLF